MHNGDGQPASNLGAGRLHVPPFAWPPFAAAVGDPSAFFGLGVGPAQLAVPATSAAPSSDSQLALGLDIEGQPRKARKPYTITKQRERWTEEEHNLFLEALKLHGRAWRKIEEHVGTKTAVQIRSHAQKFFSKLEKGQTGANSGDGKGGDKSGLADISIPPPRPKRKPMYPYPRKAPEPVEPEPVDMAAVAQASVVAAQAAAQEAALATSAEAYLMQGLMSNLFDAQRGTAAAFQTAAASSTSAGSIPAVPPLAFAGATQPAAAAAAAAGLLAQRGMFGLPVPRPGAVLPGMMMPQPLNPQLLQFFAQQAGAAASKAPFMSQQQAAEQLAASAYMAQIAAGLPHPQATGLPPGVPLLTSLMEGRGYTWGADAPGALRHDGGGGFSPAVGGGAGGSAGGGSAGGGSGGGSGGTHSSGAMSQGPLGGSSPSGSASASEEEVEGERKKRFKGNGGSSSGSGGTEGNSDKEGRPQGPALHLTGNAPGSSSAFTSFARWPASAPSGVWAQQPQQHQHQQQLQQQQQHNHQTVDSANYRAMPDAAQLAKQAATAAHVSAATAFRGQETAGFPGAAGNGAAGPSSQAPAPLPLAPPPRIHAQAAQQPGRRAECAGKGRDKKGDAADGGASNGGSGGAYSVSSGDPAGNDRGTSNREKTPHGSSSDEANGGPKVPGSPSAKDGALKHLSSATGSRGNGNSGNGTSGNDSGGNGGGSGGGSQDNGGTQREGSTDRENEGSAEGSAGRSDGSDRENSAREGEGNGQGENSGDGGSGDGSGGGSSEGAAPHGGGSGSGSGAGSGCDDQERSDDGPDGAAAAGAAADADR